MPRGGGGADRPAQVPARRRPCVGRTAPSEPGPARTSSSMSSEAPMVRPFSNSWLQGHTGVQEEAGPAPQPKVGQEDVPLSAHAQPLCPRPLDPCLGLPALCSHLHAPLPAPSLPRPPLPPCWSPACCPPAKAHIELGSVRHLCMGVKKQRKLVGQLQQGRESPATTTQPTSPRRCPPSSPCLPSTISGTALHLRGGPRQGYWLVAAPPAATAAAAAAAAAPGQPAHCALLQQRNLPAPRATRSLLRQRAGEHAGCCAVPSHCKRDGGVGNQVGIVASFRRALSDLAGSCQGGKRAVARCAVLASLQVAALHDASLALWQRGGSWAHTPPAHVLACCTSSPQPCPHTPCAADLLR